MTPALAREHPSTSLATPDFPEFLYNHPPSLHRRGRFLDTPVLGTALHGWSPFVPIESQQVRCLATVIAIVTLTVASHLMGRRIARPPAP